MKYILVGGFSVIIHAYARTTGDMDIWVKRSISNYEKLVKAFLLLGMPVFDMTENNFMSHPAGDVFTFGRPPVAIDIMTKLKGLEFGDCYSKSVLFDDNGLKINTIHKNSLIKAKKSAGRSKDLNDLESNLIHISLRFDKDDQWYAVEPSVATMLL